MGTLSYLLEWPLPWGFGWTRLGSAPPWPRLLQRFSQAPRHLLQQLLLNPGNKDTAGVTGASPIPGKTRVVENGPAPPAFLKLRHPQDFEANDFPSAPHQLLNHQIWGQEGPSKHYCASIVMGTPPPSESAPSSSRCFYLRCLGHCFPMTSQMSPSRSHSTKSLPTTHALEAPSWHLHPPEASLDHTLLFLASPVTWCP